MKEEVSFLRVLYSIKEMMLAVTHGSLVPLQGKHIKYSHNTSNNGTFICNMTSNQFFFQSKYLNLF